MWSVDQMPCVSASYYAGLRNTWPIHRVDRREIPAVKRHIIV